jgi:hypothetical protein
MSTSKLLQIVKARGLRLELRDGRPVIVKGVGDHCTDKLLAVLKIHREKIIEALKKTEDHEERFPDA